MSTFKTRFYLLTSMPACWLRCWCNRYVKKAIETNFVLGTVSNVAHYVVHPRVYFKCELNRYVGDT